MNYMAFSVDNRFLDLEVKDSKLYQLFTTSCWINLFEFLVSLTG